MCKWHPLCALGLVLTILTGCNRDTPTQNASTQPSSGLRAFLSNQIRVGTIDTPTNPPKAIVCFFTRTDCPVSNSYAPEVRRMYESFSPRGVEFYLVYPDADESRQMIEKHLKEYSYPFPGLRDPKHELVKLAGAKITPEAAGFDVKGKLLYLGRIDDRYV